MTIAVKNNNKTPLVVPPAVRRKAGFKSGQELEIRASGGMITILPKSPATDREYTPEQRRAIDARLAQAGKGPYYGPFENADDAVRFLNREIRTRKGKPKTTKG